MPLFARAASLAAVLCCAVALAGPTSPGFAHDLPGAQLVLNASPDPQVPDSYPEGPPPPALEIADAPVATPSPVPAVVTQAVLDEDYDTLAEAVAAQTALAEDRELRCLAAGVYYESNGEPLAGQLAVAQTILNRAKSGRFPKSVCSVLTQPGQFSFVRGGTVPSAEGRRGWTTAVAVAKVAHRDLWEDVAPDALFFHARHVAPRWQKARVAAIGNHVFYR